MQGFTSDRGRLPLTAPPLQYHRHASKASLLTKPTDTRTFTVKLQDVYSSLGFTSKYFLTSCCECCLPAMIIINKPCAKPLRNSPKLYHHRMIPSLLAKQSLIPCHNSAEPGQTTHGRIKKLKQLNYGFYGSTLYMIFPIYMSCLVLARCHGNSQVPGLN